MRAANNGEAQTGTQAETPETAKAEPKVSERSSRATAEEVEGRALAKGNSRQRTTPRTQGRASVPQELERIGHAAKKDRKVRFTALMHHVYKVDRLREAYFGLKRDAAAGVDGETWRSYGEQLEERLQDLSGRLKRGAYRARPVRRTYIPKASGGERPLGVTALEDKLVQRAVVRVLNEIYERDFLGFSYGFRPGRDPHAALDALCIGLERRKVNWVLDADIRRYFDSIDHGWLRKFVEHRIADQRIVRLIMKWLKAGVLEEGKWTRSETGTPQGGVISPLLANVFLHYVFDLWAHAWRRRRARGDVVIVRYADDFVVGFEHEAEARQFRQDLEERFSRFGLELHPEKTRLIEFGRYAATRRERAGLGKPETFDFLGFTHVSGKTQRGRPTVLRLTSRKRLKAKLREVKTELMRRRHDPIPAQGRYLRDVISGHNNYYGVPMNGRALAAFRHHLARPWKRALARRSQKGRVTWERVERLVARYLPHPRIRHPFPAERHGLTTRGRSPVQ
jgi:RNA-directed DNA polymerase